MMKRRLATALAATTVIAASVAIAPSALASNNFAVSISVPGFSAGYSNRGFGYVAAAPVPYIASAPVVTYAAPVVFASYYRPYVAAPYRFHAPVRVGYYGHAHW